MQGPWRLHHAALEAHDGPAAAHHGAIEVTVTRLRGFFGPLLAA
ncbi:hypothetical protein ACFPK5_01065 [Streptomyces beijiangensis]